MNETEIKAAVLQHIRTAVGRKKKPIVASEFRLGRSAARADLAILSDEFIGIEIKSARDTLRRLDTQLFGYTRYFERVILIVAEKHAAAVTKMNLSGAALWIVNDKRQVREARSADPAALSHPSAYLDLLTKEDVRQYLHKDFCLVSGKEDFLRQALQKAFSRRYSRTSDTFWKAVAGRRISTEDLIFLSRYSEQRTLHRENLRERQDFWQSWVQQLDTKTSPPSPLQFAGPHLDSDRRSAPEDGC